MRRSAAIEEAADIAEHYRSAFESTALFSKLSEVWSMMDRTNKCSKIRRDGGAMCALCEGRSMDEYVDNVEDSIRRHGWALQYVESELDTSGDDDVLPAFCYTVGLTSRDHPEIVLTGRAAGESADVLDALARRISYGGARFEAGMECTAAGFHLSFVDVSGPREWLVMAERIYPGAHLRAVQAVWRDVRGHLPWEGDYPSTIVQPVLGPPPGWYDEF